MVATPLLVWSKTATVSSGEIFENKEKTDSNSEQLLGSALKPGRVIRVNRVTFSPGLTRFTNYPGLTQIGSREKRNCSFDDVETYKRYRVALL